jgi:ribosome-associated protein
MNDDILIINQDVQIPLAELIFRFTVSSGPGGQHANKAATQVTLSFDVANSPSLDEASRARLLAKLANRLDKEGVLQISVQDSRSQVQNRATAVARFQQLVADALKVAKKRQPTRPSRAAHERRLQSKRRRGQIKQQRRSPWKED